MSSNTDLLLCDVGDHHFAFRSRDVWHVERAEHLRRESRADGRAGVLMLGEVAVEVFSLAAVLGVAGDRSTGNDSHIAVTGNSEGLFGWLADRIARADHTAAAHIAPLPSLIGSPANAWFEGAVHVGEQPTALLLRPQCINPLYPESPPVPTDVLVPAEASPGLSVEPVAVIFKTASLPPSAATRYALSGKQILGIVQAGPLVKVTACADHVRGLTWWRRSIVPVIDWNRGNEHWTTTNQRLLITRCGTRHHRALVALPVDAEVVMCRADGNQREMRDVERPWFASGVFDINGEPVALLDLDALLEPGASGARHGDAVLPDLLVERAARDAEPICGALDSPAFGAQRARDFLDL